MTPLLRLSGFLAVLLVVFLASMALGNAVGPLRQPVPVTSTHQHGGDR